MSITIIDNFLDDETFKPIQELLLGSWFPWFFNRGIVSIDDAKIINDIDLFDFQFTHTFVQEEEGIVSDHIVHLHPFINKINPQRILRLKTNLQTPTIEPIRSRFHTDVENTTGVKTAIYYVNTNNGFTVFEDDIQVKSIENRLVIFDSSMLHAGTTCTDQKSRCVINFNFIESTK
jgi:hypothetical protein